MIIDITPLNYGKDVMKIIGEVDIPKEDIKKTELIDLYGVKVDGYLERQTDDYLISLKISGTMVLPCARTLEPTEHKFNIEMENNIIENDEKIKKNKKTIDILPIIWENILMEIPIKIVNPNSQNIKLKGDGWELITDSES